MNPNPFPLWHMPSSGICRDLSVTKLKMMRSLVCFLNWGGAGAQQLQGSRKETWFWEGSTPQSRVGLSGDRERIGLAFSLIYLLLVVLTWQGEGLVLAYSKRGYSPLKQGKCGHWSRRRLVTLCPQSQSRKKKMNACAQFTFSFLIQSRITAQGMRTPTFRVGLPTSISLI